MILIVANIQTHITYALKNPKKKPKILSIVPKPVYVIAFLIDLLIKNNKNNYYK